VESVKRIEILAASAEMNKIIKALDKAEVPGYSVIENVTGKGHWGTVSDELNLGSSKLGNFYLICFCSQEQLELLEATIKPVLKKYGGVCYASDAFKVY
jgi:nitrogen regulatory protein PII